MLAADPADRAGVHQEADAVGVGVHVGKQVAANLQRQGRDQAVAAPVGGAGDDEAVAADHGGLVGQLICLGNHIGQIAHADFVAAVADADGRQPTLEQPVHASGLRRYVAPAHIAIDAVGVPGTPFDGDEQRRVTLSDGFLHEVVVDVGILDDGEPDNRGGIPMSRPPGRHHVGHRLIRRVHHRVAQFLQGVADGESARRPVGFRRVAHHDVEPGGNDHRARVDQCVTSRLGAEIHRHVGAQRVDAAAVVVEDDVFDGSRHGAPRVRLRRSRSRGGP